MKEFKTRWVLFLLLSITLLFSQTGLTVLAAEGGSYAFTPVPLERYTLAEGVGLPETWMMVGGAQALVSDPERYVFNISEGEIKVKAGIKDSNKIYVSYGAQKSTGEFDPKQNITITGSVTVDTVFSVETSNMVHVTFRDLSIDKTSIKWGMAVSLEDNTNVNLTLQGTNILKSGYGCAGLQVNNSAKLTITAESTGKLTATGGIYGAGIGGGANGSGGNIKINGGTVTATGGSGGKGIGGTFSTTDKCGIPGNAVIIASSISDNSGEKKNNWSGVIVEGNSGKVYGTPTVSTNAELPSGKMLTIESGKTLTTGKDTTLINRGTIQVDAGATLINNGTINNDGTLLKNGTLINNGTITTNGAVVVPPHNINNRDLTLTENACKGVCFGHTVEGTTTRYKIVVQSGTHDITLNGVEIRLSADNACAFELQGTARVNLTLADNTTNTLKSGDNNAGLQVQTKDSNISATLTIDGKGSLNATGGAFSAGIGGGKGGSSGNVAINSGAVTATGGGNGAGIGGGANGSGGNIKINGGMVTANGGTYGAGIGGGYHGSAGNIEISAGTVRGKGGSDGAGIGGGYQGSGGSIAIHGGTVTATGGSYGAGISGGNIEIHGGTVTADGGYRGAGIGGGCDISGGSITISGGTVTATGVNGGAGIGGGERGAGGNIKIIGGTVTATGDSNGAGLGAGIGGGYQASGGTFSTSDEGGIPSDVVIIASSISDKSSQGSWSGVIIEGNSGAVYGNSVALTTDVEIPFGKTLTIENEKTLIVGKDTTLTNRGTIKVNPDAMLINNDTIKVNPGATLINNGAVDNSAGTIILRGNLIGNAICGGTIDSLPIHDISKSDLKLTAGGCSGGCAGHTVSGKTSQYRIVVESGEHYITLGGVDIRTSNNTSPLDMQNAGGSILTLQSDTTNILDGCATSNYGPGIWVPANRLTITGTGKLIAKGGASWPGIGRMGGGDILIESGVVEAIGGSNAAGIGGSWGFSGGSVEISGGTVTANGGRGGAGIGGGYKGFGSNIEISGGMVTATGGGDGAGIGEILGGKIGSSSTFSTGASGNAVIIASTISDNSAYKKNNWSGVIIEGDTGVVYSNSITLTTGAEIPAGKTLTIESGKSLTLGSGVTLTNRGTITVKKSGKLDSSNGVFHNLGTLN